MNLTEATMLALQGKLVEGLKFNVNNKWIPYDKNDRDKIDNYVKQIADTNKPIKYTYIKGYNNWEAVRETKELSLILVRMLFLQSSDEYIVTEEDDCVLITKIESRN